MRTAWADTSRFAVRVGFAALGQLLDPPDLLWELVRMANLKPAEVGVAVAEEELAVLNLPTSVAPEDPEQDRVSTQKRVSESLAVAVV